ncbi:hypothetical protein FHX68_2592 [Microbacterium lacticum]|uniref:Uncharacterized protein n=1 Tax=Microbacterium lacticum TaxID=33885 RepID=A0A4Y3UPR0_9MICO|nr:hypothetical protein [Microbacterium lacticum]TQM91374.1 hypothetical protein FHX68_2592 [Microbacterium lacticum]GEB96094.1 hypothetical protein MLA01_23130 [Microbacterium lacticum]GGI71799.1 hypothetical protein GCM10009724_23410 [Microbacterium lacticum]
MDAPAEPLSVLTDEGVATFSPRELRAMRDEFQRFLLEYQFGLREVETKRRRRRSTTPPRCSRA